MKLTIFLLLVCCIHLCAKTSGQGITLSLKKAPLQQVFKEIFRQSGLSVIYDEEQIKKLGPVSIEVKNASVATVLTICLAGKPFDYVIADKAITIIPKPLPPRFNQRDSSPSISAAPITGRVTDASGNPLAGISIVVKGTKTGTNTDANGNFLINAGEGSVLIISGIGFSTKTIKVSNGSVWEIADQKQKEGKLIPGPDGILIIRLEKYVQEQEAVTVLSTGYQDINKNFITGSFVKIDNALLNRTVSTNILDRILNVTPGLRENNSPMTSVNHSSITIRGISTFNSNQRPLIVIDGFPQRQEGIGGPTVDKINPNDVESITILKDAAAAAIWGARAGNGVIVITTKKGKMNQKLKIGVVSNLNITTKPDLYYAPMISSAQSVAIQREMADKGLFDAYDNTYPLAYNFPPLPSGIEILLAQRKGSITREQADAQLALLAAHDMRNDFNKYLLQHSINQQYAINISGGSGQAGYYASVGYDKNRGTNKRDESERFTFRSDNTFRPAKNLELNAFISFVQIKKLNNGIDFSSLVRGPYYERLADEAGNALPLAKDFRMAYVDTVNYPALMDWHYRPLDELRLNDNTVKNSDTRLGATLKYTIFRGVNVEVKYQYQQSTSEDRRMYHEQSYFVRNLVNTYMFRSNGKDTLPVPKGAIIDLTNSKLITWNARASLNFNRQFGKHIVSAMAGLDGSEAKTSGNSNRRYGFNVANNSSMSVMNFERLYTTRPTFSKTRLPNPGAGSETGLTTRLISYFANGTYTYANKYTMTATAKQDGANLFGVKANHRLTPLWSAGLSWNLSRETFYSLKWLPMLALRASYGYTGNISEDATTLPIINTFGVNLLGAAVTSINNSPNPSIRWEKVRIVNFGLDFANRNNRITGSVEYYRKTGLDLIGSILVDPTTGFNNYTGNYASIKGWGWDLKLQTMNLVRPIQWSTAFILSYNMDKVTNYTIKPSVGMLLSGQQLGTPMEGKPLNGIYSYRWAGLDPTNGDPRGYLDNKIASYNDFSDIQGKKNYDNLVYHGTGTPRFTGSLLNAISWKNISLSWMITYYFNYYLRRTSANYYSFFMSGTGHSDYNARWRKPGDEAFTNVPSQPDPANLFAAFVRDDFYQSASILVERADHIRLQDLRIEYDLPGSLLKHLSVQGMNFFVTASNLGILWRANNKGIDPKAGTYGPPVPRSYAAGLTIGL